MLSWSLRLWVALLSLAWGSGGVWVGVARGGDLDPPGGAVAPTMKTLEEVEPRVAVTAENTPGDAAAMFVIDAPGSYYLTGDVRPTSDLHGVEIRSDDVTLDLMGFTIDGSGVVGNRNGVSSNQNYSRVTIRNGRITNWGASGVYGEELFESRAIDLHVSNVGAEGIFLSTSARIEDCSVIGCGVGIESTRRTVVEGCRVESTTSSGIGVAGESVVRRNVVCDTGSEGIRASTNCLVEGNEVFQAVGGSGIRASGSDHVVRDNRVRACLTGLEVTGSGCVVRGNIVEGNGDNYVLAAGNELELVLSEIPEVIEWPCRVTLAGTLTGVAGQNGITISSGDVAIDLGGHALVGVVGSLSGIEATGAFDSLRVMNGSVRDWDGDGIDLRSDTFGGSSHRVEKCDVSNAGGRGIRCGLRSFVLECTSTASVDTGIEVDHESVVEHCAARDGMSTGILVRSHSTLRECRFRENVGFGCSAGGSVVVERCTAWMNGSHGIVATFGTTIRGCSSQLNGGSGISSTGALILENVCRFNDEAGIRLVGDGAHVEGNSLLSNPTGVLGISTALENTIVRNTIRDSTTPIDVAPSNEVGAIQSSPVGAGAWDNLVP